MNESDEGFEQLFNGTDLSGWLVKPRLYGDLYPGGPSVLEAWPEFGSDYNERALDHIARWNVEDGALVGRQDTPGGPGGGYLVTERTFTDFELRLEMKPDWPADTGVMVRKQSDGFVGLQVLVDHRRSGNIGGFYGNGLASFHAIPFAITAELDGTGKPVGLAIEDPADSLEPFDPAKAELLEYAATPQDFLTAWRWDDWNELTVRCVGDLPAATTWINGVKIASVDLATMHAPHFVAADAARVLDGHIALEVHDTDPWLGAGRWGRDAACRWRNIRIREL